MSDVIEIDALTGEVTERDFTPEELAQREADQAAAVAAQLAVDEAAAVTATAKASAESKLAALGLTPDEIAALGSR